jgi:3-oxoacyl-[acyl-carrier-protein] synthase-3
MSADGARAGILGTGSFLPERVLDNRELAERFGCSEEWIVSRTGIRERRFADPGTGSSHLGVRAAERALADAGVTPREIDLIICATYTPDMAFPSTACIIQETLGAKPAAAFDLQAACSGFVYALVTAAQYVSAGHVSKALVVAAEINSTIVDPTDQKVTPLFGDGAGAVVVGRVDDGTGLLGFHLGADGGGGRLFYMPAGGSRRPATAETVEAREHYIKMDGPSLFRFGVEAIVQASRNALDRASLPVEAVDLFIPHQANVRILDAGVARLGIPPERTVVTLDRFANTAAASIPIALDQASRAGRLAPGNNVLMTGFGAGLTWGSAVVRWSRPAAAEPRPLR